MFRVGEGVIKIINGVNFNIEINPDHEYDEERESECSKADWIHNNYTFYPS